jgi:hypothetical protein
VPRIAAQPRTRRIAGENTGEISGEITGGCHPDAE